MTGSDQLLTTVEVAEMLNVPIGTLRWWRHVGEGPKSWKLGRRKVVYSKSDVDAWLQAQYDAANPVAS